MAKRVLWSCTTVLLAVLSVCLAAALLLLSLDPFLSSILADDQETVKICSTKKTIILDPGHGGEDSGAVGINGSYEKDLNLTISQIMKDLLTVCGYSVIMTREEDVLLFDEENQSPKKSQDLKNRVDFGTKYPDAIFVSIHMNKFSQEKYRGLQVYYSPNRPESSSLAEWIQTTVRCSLQPDNNRQIKAATSSIYILHRIQIPAVLIECGFLSNAEEESLLTDSAYQMMLAGTICSALNSWIETSEIV
jgi:N-acetylmuramoyl-L-alanine amidase